MDKSEQQTTPVNWKAGIVLSTVLAFLCFSFAYLVTGDKWLLSGFRYWVLILPVIFGVMYFRIPVKLITGLIGTMILAIFILGLSHSISTGFAGFNGGLPFLIIAVFCLLLAFYDYWDQCIRKPKQDED